MNTEYQLLPELFLRAPFYSFASYDLDWLPQVLEEEPFRNAIWLASPALYKVLQAKDFMFARLTEKEQLTLYKYYNRMCFRPTPFGSFASFTLLKWGDGGPVRLAETSRSVLHLFPDLELLESKRSRKNQHKSCDLLASNPTLYRFGREFRFVKSSPRENGRLQFSIEAIEAESLVIQLVTKLKKEAITAGALADWLHVRSGADRQSVLDYVDFLIDEQVLFPADCTGMIGAVAGFPAGFPVPGKNTPLLKTGPLAEMAGSAQATGAEQCFYAALERPPVSGGLGQDDRDELQVALKVLKRLAFKNTPLALEKFKLEFAKRFDQEKVPLMLALDPDSGISYANLLAAPGAGLLADVRFPQPEIATVKVDWNPARRLLFKLMAGARCQDKFAQVTISPEDLEELPAGETALWPPTQVVMFRKTEEYLLVEYAGGASATAMIGRFSLFSEEIAALCRKLAAIETAANPGVLFADIDQRSHLHTDNINRRENIYDFNIPVNCYSAPSSRRQIPPGDLLLSVRSGELVLESKSLGKRVIPRLATAFNYRHNDLALFRLLCDLQFQQLSVAEALDLEGLFPGMNFYPRVVTGHIILSLAKWKISEKAVTALLSKSGGTAVERLRKFRSEFNIPVKVSLGASDQQLVFNLANEQEAAFFLSCLKGLGRLTLQEYLPPSRDVKIGSKPLAAQFIAFMTHRSAPYRLAAVGRGTKSPGRNFMLGSEWLYLKVFCTPQAADHLLASVVRPFLQRQKKYIRQWFFIRYEENGHHLRLRFCASPEQVGGLLAAFRRAVNKTGSHQLIRDCTGDTYRRELERYGHVLIEETENVFWAGSELVCEYFKAVPCPENEQSAFTMAFYTAYEMIRCFIPDHLRQLSFIGEQVHRFSEEFGGGKQLKTDLDLKYRSLKSYLDLTPDGLSAPGITPEFNAKFKILLAKARVLAETAKKHKINDVRVLLADVVHMQMNRSFQVNGRQQEFLVYFCLDKAMRSLAARDRQEVYSR